MDTLDSWHNFYHGLSRLSSRNFHFGLSDKSSIHPPPRRAARPVQLPGTPAPGTGSWRPSFSDSSPRVWPGDRAGSRPQRFPCNLLSSRSLCRSESFNLAHRGAECKATFNRLAEMGFSFGDRLAQDSVIVPGRPHTGLPGGRPASFNTRRNRPYGRRWRGPPRPSSGVSPAS
jgi:hypothetical protein